MRKTMQLMYHVMAQQICKRTNSPKSHSAFFADLKSELAASCQGLLHCLANPSVQSSPRLFFGKATRRHGYSQCRRRA